ncbi:MFS transporter [Hydrogenophaga luteola]|uniref:MFS transporter n=1 Tax=Hydrogenophaga luteola TaxID=1591122 RepID=A0ABV7W9G5_9BURK
MPTPDTLLLTDQHSRRAAWVLGLSLPGDTALYLLLPMFAPAFGVSLPEAGMLLAANRLVRIAGYGAVARSYARHGERRTCTLAALAAAVCALGYATLTGFIALLCLRLVWGLAFAALNLATQALATAEPAGAARRAGRSRAVTALGPMLALPLGGVCALWAGPKIIFFLFAMAALVAVAVARQLPDAPHAEPQPEKKSSKLPGSLDRFSFVEGLVLDGLFIIGLSYLGRDLLPGQPVLVAGLLLSVRYLAEIVLASSGGHLADKHDPTVLLVVFAVLTSIAIAGFGFGWLWSCALAIVILRALLLPLLPTLVALRTPGPGRIQALATRSVWRDMGAGGGPVLAGLLLPVVPAAWIYGGAALLLATTAMDCLKPHKR